MIMWGDLRDEAIPPRLFPTGMWNQYRRTIVREDVTNHHAHIFVQ